MSLLPVIANYAAVSLFGCILSASFCNVEKSRKSRIILGCFVAITMLLQGGVAVYLGTDTARTWYPLLTHIPLILTLWYLGKRLLSAVSACFTAYLCCQFRRWLALFILWLFGGNDSLFVILELLLTVPLLLVMLKMVSPSMRQVFCQSLSVQLQFAVIPSIYYAFDYAATVFTDALYNGGKEVVEFMPTVCCFGYIWFLTRTSQQERKRYELELETHSLNMRMEQSVLELEDLRRANAQAAEYRHDLRHHMQYLFTCMEDKRYTEAQEYTQSVCAAISAQQIVQYCENENINLILSVFEKRALEAHIQMNIQVFFPKDLKPVVNDICVLLSNALENAINACSQVVEEEMPVIEIEGYQKNDKIFFQISNPCKEEPVFKNGRPVSPRAGHGTGTGSICSIVKKYDGLCSFTVKNGFFYVRVSL